LTLAVVLVSVRILTTASLSIRVANGAQSLARALVAEHRLWHYFEADRIPNGHLIYSLFLEVNAAHFISEILSSQDKFLLGSIFLTNCWAVRFISVAS
jgi:hypothetical protein